MDTFTVELKVPECLRELGYSPEEISRELPILLVLRRFRQGALSSSRAASILGVSRRDFFDLLAKEGIPIYDPPQDELEAEFSRAKTFGPSS